MIGSTQNLSDVIESHFFSYCGRPDSSSLSSTIIAFAAIAGKKAPYNLTIVPSTSLHSDSLFPLQWGLPTSVAIAHDCNTEFKYRCIIKIGNGKIDATGTLDNEDCA